MSEEKSVIIPDAIQEIFDNANEATEDIVVTTHSIQVVSKDHKTLLQEIEWPEVGKWTKVFIGNLLKATENTNNETNETKNET